MPGCRYIIVPVPVTLHDPETGEVLMERNNTPKVVGLKELLQKVMHNPMWSESFPNMCSAQEIIQAYEKARDGVMVLAEDDWKKLEDAVMNPKQVINNQILGTQTQVGLGYHPALSPQLITLIEPIVNASQKPPEGTKKQ